MNEDLCRKKSIAIEKRIEEIQRFYFDRDLIIEALENIILNAVDSMPDGGTLTIVIEKDEHVKDPQVHIKIQDTGAGISEDRIEMIFEPFFTSKVTDKGIGLGLSITRKIMESLNGTVEFQSKLGKGSVVTLSLPYALKNQSGAQHNKKD
jgi:signal transduction histidine kinase